MNTESKQEASHMYVCIEQANTIHILQYCINIHLVKGETYLRKLFRFEDKADESALTLEKRLEMRKIKSKQVLDEFYSWISQI